MAIDRLVDSVLDYFRLPEHKKNAPPGVGARVHPAPEENVPVHREPIPGRQQVQEPRPIARSAPDPTSPPATQPESTSRHHVADQTRQPAPSQMPPKVATHEQLEDPIRILLVEDDPKWAKLVNAYVAAINGEKTLGVLDLDWVETLEATLTKVAKNSYDLIFLDLMLPDSLGINTLESVWAKVSKVQSPVVVMSNLDSGGIMDRVREVTGRDILLKKNISKKVLFGHIDTNVFEDDF